MKNHMVIAALEGCEIEHFFMEAEDLDTAVKQVAKDLMNNEPDNEYCVYITFACECPAPTQWKADEVINPDEVTP